MTTPADITALLSNRWWRLENLYLIINEDGDIEPWVMRDEQREFLRDRHTRNFIPKARKLGISTAAVLSNGDECVMNGTFKAGIIDITEKDAWDKLDMFRFAWNQGPFHPRPEIAAVWKLIHASNPLVSDSAGKMEWKNESSFTAGVSYTGKTPQRLHISEYGPISAQNPRKADKIKRGSINAAPLSAIIDIETTMEGGRYGACYGFFKLAKDATGKALSAADWKLFFFPWYNHPSYRLPGQRAHNHETLEYFRKLEEEHGLSIPDERQAFYEAKKREQGDDIYTQFPSVVSECDRLIVPGQIFPEMTALRARGQVTDFQQEPGLPLFTSWDLGSSDNIAGSLIQPAGKAHNVLDWTAGEGKGAPAVAEVIRRWEAQYGVIAGNLLPHDAEITDKGSGKTYVQQLIECGIQQNKITVVPRIPDKWVGINEVRRLLPNFWFHARTDKPLMTETGDKLPSAVERMEGYRKAIDHSTGVAKPYPVGDICSHYADSVRTYAEALSRSLVVAHVETYDRAETEVVTGYRGRRR